MCIKTSFWPIPQPILYKAGTQLILKVYERALKYVIPSLVQDGLRQPPGRQRSTTFQKKNKILILEIMFDFSLNHKTIRTQSHIIGNSTTRITNPKSDMTGGSQMVTKSLSEFFRFLKKPYLANISYKFGFIVKIKYHFFFKFKNLVSISHSKSYNNHQKNVFGQKWSLLKQKIWQKL